MEAGAILVKRGLLSPQQLSQLRVDRPDPERFRPGRGTGREPAGPGPRRGAGPGRRGPHRVPVLERDPRQYRRHAEPDLNQTGVRALIWEIYQNRALTPVFEQ